MSMTPWFGGLGGMDMDMAIPSSVLCAPFAGGSNRDDAAAVARTSVDWKETEKEHIFTAEIPGVRKEDVKVEVEEDGAGAVLRISGEKAREQAEAGDTWKRVERSYGSFLRRFRLPDGARADGSIRCTLEDGVLRVVVPKDQTAQKRRDVRAIDIS